MNYSTKFKPKASYETPACLIFEKCNLILCSSPYGKTGEAGSINDVNDYENQLL